MANKVLSIEIGSGITKVLEMDYKVKSPKIYNAFNLETPDGVISDGAITYKEIYKNLLLTGLRSRGINTKKVIYVLNSSRIAIREAVIPAVKDNRIADVVRANANDYFPIDLAQYELSHQVIEHFEEKGDKKIRISVLAIPKDLMEGYKAFSNECGLECMGVSFIGGAITKMMAKEMPDEIKATVKVDENNSILTILKGDRVLLQRTINYGLGEALDTIIDSKLYGDSMTQVDALNIARHRTFLYRRFDQQKVAEDDERDDGIDAAKLASLRDDVTDSVRTLVGNINRIIDYFHSTNADVVLDRFYLIGLGADFSGLSKLLTQELNIKVSASANLSGVTLGSGSELASINIAEYFTCIGAVKDPILFEEEKGKKKSKPVDDTLTNGWIGLGVCLIIAIALIVYSLMTSMMVKNENVELQQTLSKLTYIEDIVQANENAKANAAWAENLESATTTHNDEMLAFLTELEDKMPSEINILSLTADEATVTISLEVGSKTAAADVVAQLRTFESIEVSGISTLVEDTDDSGVTTVSFSVTCNYRTVTEDATEGEEANTDNLSEVF